MSIATFILGESGTGKSTSLRNMDPEQTLLIQSIKKPLPFRSEGWKYITKGGGNMIVQDDANHIIELMRRTKRDVIVIDDYQYILANEFMRRTDERGFDKFTDIGKHAWEIIRAAADLADHKRDTNEVVINKAINSTLGRTMNTSLTTLLVLFVIFLFGGVSIKGFIFALLIGILVGTYSSVFVASSFVVDLLKRKDSGRAA